METIPASALDNFYQMVLKDFVQISEKYITSSQKNTEEASKNKDKKEEKGNDTINDLLNTCFLTIISISDKKRNDHNLYEFIYNYATNIKDYFLSKKENKIDTMITEDKDIYRAYGFLWSLRYLLNDVKLDHISLFNYKEYSNFSNFLETFGNSKNISKNYNKNFMEERGKEKIDINLVHKWIGKLKEGKLSPMAKSVKSLKKKKKKQQNENNDNQENPTSNNINNNIENFEPKEEKEESSNNIINIETETLKNDIINSQQEKKSEKIEKDTEGSSEDNKNKSIIQNTISSNSNSSNSCENETTNENNNSDKNKNNANVIITEKIFNAPSVDLVIKSEKNNLIDLCKNNFSLNPEISELMNIFSVKFNSLENKITQQNLEILKNKEDISKHKEKLSKYEEEISKNEQEILKNKEEIVKNKEEISKHKEEILKNKEEISKYKEKLSKYEEEISKNEQEISTLKTENKTLSERVQKLEVNQLMLYHQISLYQNSRDMYKSISYYFYDFLNLKQVQTTKFDKTKAIIEYLENKDKEKVNNMINNGSKSIDENIKKKLTNYFRFHYFVYLSANKIIHRNFKELQQKILKEQKDDGMLSLLPNFDFNQCFDSLEFFIENNAKNNKINTAMKFVYENIYKKDQNLGAIKDDKHEVIDINENGIYFKIKKDDISVVKNYFQNIKMENNDNFVDLCNKKTWDQAGIN